MSPLRLKRPSSLRIHLPGKLGFVATTWGRSKLTPRICGYLCTMYARIIPELPPTSTSVCTRAKPWYLDSIEVANRGVKSRKKFWNSIKNSGCTCMYSNWFIPCAAANGSSEFTTASLHARAGRVKLIVRAIHQ